MSNKKWCINSGGISRGMFWIQWPTKSNLQFDITIPWFFHKFKGVMGMKGLTLLEINITRHFRTVLDKVEDGLMHMHHEDAGLKGIQLEILNQRLSIDMTWNECGNWFQCSSEVATINLYVRFSCLKIDKGFWKKWRLNKTRRPVNRRSTNYPIEGFTNNEQTAYLLDFTTGPPAEDYLYLPEGFVQDGEHCQVRDCDIKYWFSSLGKLNSIRFQSLPAFNVFAGRCRRLGYEIYTIEDYKEIVAKNKKQTA